jgi:hypothetical protein
MMALVVFAALSTTAAAQIRTTRTSNWQTRGVVTRLETKTDQFRRYVEAAINRTPINNTGREDRITDFMNDFENATDQLRRDFDAGQNIDADVQAVLERALYIDRFMTRNRLSYQAQNQWTSIRTDLNTLARSSNVAWNWNRVPNYDGGYPNTGGYPNNGYPSGNQNLQARSVIAGLEAKTDQFRRYTQASLDRSPINGTNREDRITDFLTNFENATDALRRDYDSGQNVDAEVQNVLTSALYIDRFMSRNRLSVQSESSWSSIRTDLNSLARIYNVSWNWNRVPDYNAGFPNEGPVTGGGGNYGGRGLDSRLTGTYRLNRSQSDDINTILARSETGVAASDRDRVRRQIERRLTAPEMIAIEKVGNTVNLASSLAPQVTIDADGIVKTETTPNGRTIRTTACANRDSLLISYEGDRANDFYLTFMPSRDGQLRVTRKLYLENQNQTVSVTSVYDKINNVAQWSSIQQTNVGGPIGGVGVGGTREFIIPSGTRLTATLRNLVTTQATQAGDRFTMDVNSPGPYSGAIIEGRVANAERSGRVTGRASLSFEFDTIRMPNGNTYRFAGNIDSIRAANGDDVRVNNEGTVRDSNQTTKTVTRAGIGAALGALIGAIAGGGQGAAIGAAVGAGAGAGTVFIQGRDNVELAPGTEFTITASAPDNVVGTRNY